MPNSENLSYTSERMNPSWNDGTANEYLIYLFHIAIYRFAQRFAEGRHVLDYGCGTGYGAHMLAEAARTVVGTEIVEEVVQHARTRYQRANLTFQNTRPAEDGPLPFDDAEFDLVVSSQVIEHVADVDAYLSEILRVLRPGGRVIIATPNRITRLCRFQKPWNIHHVTEYCRESLRRVMNRYFSNIEILGMTGEDEILAMERRRTRRIRWLSLPVTLPFMPDRLRRFGLRAAKRCGEKLRPARHAQSCSFEFDESALEIGDYQEDCVHLVATGQ